MTIIIIKQNETTGKWKSWSWPPRTSFETKQTCSVLSCHATVLLYPALSFLWTLPARLLPSFVARDGSNSFLINSSCQCNAGGGWLNPLLAVNSLLHGCWKWTRLLAIWNLISCAKMYQTCTEFMGAWGCSTKKACANTLQTRKTNKHGLWGVLLVI